MTRMATAQSALRSWSTSCPRTTSQKWISSAYVLTVAAVATVGFVAESTAVILLAALLSLPVSVIALPGYYVAYGLLTLVPGANPSTSSGAGACNANGVDCDWSSTGDPASWFQVATSVLGVIALTCAAMLNVLGLCIATAHVRRRTSST